MAAAVALARLCLPSYICVLTAAAAARRLTK
jgi:hypothetical protein